MMSVSERSRSIQARSHEIMQHSTGFEHGMLELLNPNQEFGFHGLSGSIIELHIWNDWFSVNSCYRVRA